MSRRACLLHRAVLRTRTCPNTAGALAGRRWLSGFTGSVGTLVVTADLPACGSTAATGVQAEAQLAGTGVQLMKIALATTPGHVDWLAANTRAGQRIGVDGQVLGLAAFRALSAAAAASGASLEIGADLLDDIWEGRAGLPDARIYEHVAPQVSAAPTSWRRCARPCASMAPTRISSARSTTSPGSSTCAAPTWTTTRCSSAMRWSA